MNAVRRGLARRREDWRWWSYNNFALDKATITACSIQIDYVRLPLGYRACEKPTVRTGRRGDAVATRYDGAESNGELIYLLGFAKRVSYLAKGYVEVTSSATDQGSV